MNATVCFLVAAAFQCHSIGYIAHWPSVGTGAQACSDTSDGFRCQNISRQDGFELVREYQCKIAQYAERDLPGNARLHEAEAKLKIKMAQLHLQSSEQAARGWEKYSPSDEGGKMLREAQLRALPEAREKLARAIKGVEDSRQADVRAAAEVKTRIAKWCRPPEANARPQSKLAKALAVPLDDQNPHDFPLASCKSWDGTVTERSGIDSENASMHGVVTRANVEEYCNRVVSDDRPARDAAVAECLQSTLPTATNAVLSARANCKKDTLEFSDGTNATRVRFPVANTSCGSNNPPLIAQFRKLCPKRAAELLVD